MMREIKFRAWVEGNGRSRMEYDISINDDGEMVEFVEAPYENYLISYPFAKVMQYTGLKDKSGKEIWEGDIVFSQIDSKKEIAVIALDPHAGYSPSHGLCFDNSWVEHEVIGNIYANPELLEKKHK